MIEEYALWCLCLVFPRVDPLITFLLAKFHCFNLRLKSSVMPDEECAFSIMFDDEGSSPVVFVLIIAIYFTDIEVVIS